MKIYIPEIGDVFVLTKDWWFDLHLEYRNATAWETWTGKKLETKYHFGATIKEKVKLPVDTRLTVDRIYIRKGAKEFSSVTFRCLEPGKKKGSIRFWAKLKDVNKIEADVEEKNQVL
jgi:hypothetical protein